MQSSFQRATWFALFVLLVAAPMARAGQPALGVGDAAPQFEAPTADGDVWRSRDHVGKTLLVVYFYPAAMTPGCTKQACAFRDHRSKLEALGATVVGISGDRPAGLKAFKGAYQLNFPLLSDATGAIAQQFGVPVTTGATITREIDGKTVALTRGVTAARWTIIIDTAGTIAYIDTQVNPAGDGDAVVAAISRLRNPQW